MQNGAYYYYDTAEHKDYGEAFEAVHDVEATQRAIPFRYLQIDSYW